MYSTKMRQHKILIQTLLILSIFNFALAAPAAVRARPKAHLGASVIRNVPAAPQKRADPWDWEGMPNVPAPDHTPAPSPDLADILSQIPDTNSPPLTPDYVPDHEPTSSPGLTGTLPQIVYVDTPSPTPDYGPSQIVNVDSPSPTPDHGPSQIVYVDSPSPTPDHGLPPSPDNTGSVPSELWDNVANSLPRLPSLPTFPPPPHPSQPGPSEDHSQNPSGPSVNPDTLPATGSTDNQPALPQSPAVDPSGLSVNPDTLPATGSTNSHQPALPQSPEVGPSGLSVGPSGLSVNPDTFPATGSTDSHQPALPQSPELDPQMHSLLNPESFPSDFWDKVLKGKFKRRISGSDAVNLVRKDTRPGII